MTMFTAHDSCSHHSAPHSVQTALYSHSVGAFFSTMRPESAPGWRPKTPLLVCNAKMRHFIRQFIVKYRLRPFTDSAAPHMRMLGDSKHGTSGKRSDPASAARCRLAKPNPVSVQRHDVSTRLQEKKSGPLFAVSRKRSKYFTR